MYFYYFLGYQLEGRDDLTEAQKDIRAMNTYCLALGNNLNHVYIQNIIIYIYIYIPKNNITKQ